MGSFINNIRKRLSTSSGFFESRYPNRFSLQDLRDLDESEEQDCQRQYQCHYLGSTPVWYRPLIQQNLSREEASTLEAENRDIVKMAVLDLVAKQQSCEKSKRSEKPITRKKLNKILVHVSQEGIRFEAESCATPGDWKDIQKPLCEVAYVSAAFDVKNVHIAAVVCSSTSSEGWRCYAFVFQKYDSARSFCQFLGKQFALNCERIKAESNWRPGAAVERTLISAKARLHMGINNPAMVDDDDDEDEDEEEGGDGQNDHPQEQHHAANHHPHAIGIPSKSRVKSPMVSGPLQGKSLPAPMMSLGDEFYQASSTYDSQDDSPFGSPPDTSSLSPASSKRNTSAAAAAAARRRLAPRPTGAASGCSSRTSPDVAIQSEHSQSDNNIDFLLDL